MSQTNLPFSGELARKALHLLTLSIPFGLLVLGSATALWIVTPLAVIALSADLWRSRSASFNRFVVRWLGFMMRPAERESRTGEGTVNGATWVLIAAVLTMWLYAPKIAAAALCMFLVGDAAAAVVGRTWGRIRLPGGSKTLEGSLAFAVTAACFAPWLPGAPYGIGLVGAITAATVEALPLRFNDNLFVPLLSGAAMTAAGLLMTWI